MPAPAAFFIPAAQGQRLAIHHAPAASPRSVVLFVHAFAEEMNKSRRMAALAARSLAEAGHAVLQVDLLGCGDSSGDLVDARWSDWLDDVRLGVRWLRQRHGQDLPLWLWGHRVGALVAAGAARHLDEDCQFMFWHPNTSGKQPLAQFLRLKTVAAMLQGAQSGGAPDLRKALVQGQNVEVAGYTLGAALALDMEAASLSPPPRARRALFLEVQAVQADGTLPPASPAIAGCIERWQAAGVPCVGQVVAGPAFWQTAEIEDAPALIEATVAMLDGRPGDAPSLATPAADHGEPAPAAHPGCDQPAAGRAAAQGPVSGPAEAALVFEVNDQPLLGVLTTPAGGGDDDRCVIIVVGGPQYRAGSHRLFVQLARHLACRGIMTLRFDVRGMGDSPGDWRGFEQLDDDLSAAVDAAQRAAPHLRRFMLWGLCDGASAALMFGAQGWDARIHALALVNPWVRSEQGEARTRVRHYYRDRLLQPEFWRKLASGRVGWHALKELGGSLRRMGSPMKRSTEATVPFQQRMANGWERFEGPALVMLSGNDYTAKEFADHVRHDARWSALMQRPSVTTLSLESADHTFSAGSAKAWVLESTADWIDRALPTLPA